MQERGPLCLCILDGFGDRPQVEHNAVRLARMPALEALRARGGTTLLSASGGDVGLPDGQMGNSEVGHLNLGAGRVAQMDLSRIDTAVAAGELDRNPTIAALLAAAKVARVTQETASRQASEDAPLVARVHLMGLVSDGGIHSSLEHLLALIDAVHAHALPVVVHCFLDGRDTPPKSALAYIDRLEAHLAGKGVIGTVGGRYWGMDRDQRWERVAKAFTAMVRGEAKVAPSAREAIEDAYAAGVSDEFIEPVRIGAYDGMYGTFSASFGNERSPWAWRGEEVGLAFNFRPDRMRQLCRMLLGKQLPEVAQPFVTEHSRSVVAFEPGNLISMTEYDATLEMSVAFPKDFVELPLGELIAQAGMRQFRCAETEKYAHVTYFFNGGREIAFQGEDRVVIPSPKDVPTYDKKPEMSARAVTDAVVKAIESKSYQFILLNFANPDMVGHTGDLTASIAAVEAVDEGLGRIAAALEAQQGTLVVTADHGNCETMLADDGQPHTAHTTNPVPFIWVGPHRTALRSGGRLADVAPTILAQLGLAQPAVMTGISLLLTDESQ